MSATELLARLRRLDVQLQEEDGQLRVKAPRGALTDELRAEMARRKGEIVAYLQKARDAAAAPRQPPIVPRERPGEPAPLSFAQQRLWFLDRLEPGNPFYNSPVAWRFRGDLDAGVLERALSEIVRRHEVLRSRFPEGDGGPVQVVLPAAPVPLPRIDLGDLDGDRRLAEARRLTARLGRRPFDLERGPVLRAGLLCLAPRDAALVLTVHHIVSDGWSIGVLLGELTALYEAFAAGRPSPLRPLPVQYADFAAWQRRWLGGETLERQLGYWRRQLEGLSELELPADRPRPARRGFRGGSATLDLPPRLAARLGALAQRHDGTLFMPLLAGFLTLLHRLTGQRDLVVGSPIANRNRDEVEGLIGFFVNTLVLRARLAGEPAFRDVLVQVKEAALGAYAHQDLPFETLVERLDPDRDPSRNPLVQVMFALQNAPGGRLEMAGVEIESQPFEAGTTRFDLEVHLWERNGGLRLLVYYDRDLFDHATVVRLERAYARLLEGAVRDPAAPIAELPLLSAGEEAQVVREWADTSARYPQAPLERLFAEAAAGAPDAAALVGDDFCLGYGELARRAAGLARRLQGLGVGAETPVGLLVERSPEMVVATLAALAAGGAYVPLDPEYPRRRLAWMVADSGVEVLLSDRPAVAAELAGDGGAGGDGGPAVVDLGESVAPASPRTVSRSASMTSGLSDSRRLAYVMYTSGSTGRPKGIAVTHRAVARLVLGTGYARFGPGETLHQLAPTSFDAATLEIWGALLHGARLAIHPPSRPSLEELGNFVARQRVTLLWLTAGLFHQMVEGPVERLRGVRQLLAGGDVLSPSRVRRALEALPGAAVVNGYGPTENTTFTCCHSMPTPAAVARPVPVGRPIANTRVYVLDRHLRPLPAGAVGELYAAGDGLARGYRGRPGLTAERFVPDPFRRGRLYRTGDRARWLPGGEVEFHGRGDAQVKLRGFRVEPGEIEAALEAHPSVRRAAVVVVEDAAGDRRLAAFAVPELDPLGAAGDEAPALEGEQVSQWRMVFDDLYARPAADADPTFNIVGWQSSVTGELFSPAEMREWLDDTVEAIRAVRLPGAPEPRRVLEIGCGTGMLAFRLAPDAERYVGTDLSPRALEYVERHLRELPRGAGEVRLVQAAADDLRAVEKGAFDVVVINSVAQYFPDVDYLLRVLDGAVAALRPGGRVFLGDLRSRPLLEAFHASVELARAEDSLPLEELRRRIAVATEEEDELAVDPALFFALERRLPRLGAVEVFPKRGRHHNELTRFRYQAVLHLDAPPALAADPEWLDWEASGLDLAALRRRLDAEAPAALALRGVPNARLTRPLRALERVREGAAATAGEVRGRLDEADRAPAVDPEALVALGEELGYRVDLGWTGQADGGRFEASLRRRGAEGANGHLPRPRPRPPLAAADERPWSAYANLPLRSRIAERLTDKLEAFLAERLPPHMVPRDLRLVDEMPLTANGKLDRAELARRAEAAPERASRGDFVTPRDEREELLALVWAEVLGVERVGVEDDFFDLGGHSLLATRLVSRVRRAFGVELPLRALFEEPTVAGLARRVDAARRVHAAPPIVPLERPGGAPPPETPLSFAQQRLWFLDRLMPGSASYNVPVGWIFRGALDPRALVAALGAIVRRHEVLRTAFPSRRGQPLQVVSPEPRLPLARVDLERLPAERRRDEARRLAAAEARRPFDLERGPLMRALLMRLSGDETALFLVMHHIVSDGWSLGVLLRELTELYAAARAGRPPRLGELPVQYADFAAWQRRWLAGEALEAELAYWRRRLEGAPPLELPTDRPRPELQRFDGRGESTRLDAGLLRRLSALGRRRGATLFMTLLAAFYALLHRHSGQTDIVVGTPSANRNRAEIEGLVGFFVNSLVLRAAPRGEVRFADFLGEVKETALGAFAHQDLPFEKLVEELQPRRDLSRNPIFQVMFALQNAPVGELEMAGVAVRPLPFEFRSHRFDLELHLWEGSGLVGGPGLRCDFDYDGDLFDRTTILRLARHWRALLEGVVEDPSSPLAELPTLSAAERHEALREANGPGTTAPEAGVERLFAERAAEVPEAVAVVSGDEHLSYRRLEHEAARLARRLRRLGCGPETAVGICVERSPAMAVGVLGILTAGAAYVPLDPSYPAARLAFMLEDAAVPVLLTQARLAGTLPVGSARIELLDAGGPDAGPGDDGADKAAPDQAAPPADRLAYVIYTSGSTGRPKGVALGHRALANLVRWQRRGGGSPRTLQLAPLGFDVSFQEMFATWCGGGRDGAALVLVAEDVRRDPAALLAALARHAVERLFLPYVALRQLAETATRRGLPAPRLRQVVTAGEQLQVGPTIVDFFDAMPQARLHNHYGPTESHVVTAWELAGPPAGWPALPPIGRPIAGAEALVLDRRGGPVAAGVAGELWLGGVCLARGYLGRPARTAARFRPHPWTPGARLYRTGDLARRRADGALEFLGRADQQLKVRGFRVEPGEVEVALEEQPPVRAAAVVAWRDGEDGGSGDVRLVAYVTAEGGDAETLREALRRRLPEYLVPSDFVFLDALPLTPSGKVDRRALPAPERRRGPRQAYVAPRTPVETTMAAIWAGVLGLPKVGVGDDFFDLGGHSLLATRVVSHVLEELEVELPLRALFEAPTVAGLSERVEAVRWARQGREPSGEDEDREELEL